MSERECCVHSKYLDRNSYICVLIQKFPCWRQTQSRAMAYQQRLTEFLLQGFNLQTKGWLRQSQARDAAADAR